MSCLSSFAARQQTVLCLVRLAGDFTQTLHANAAALGIDKTASWANGMKGLPQQNEQRNGNEVSINFHNSRKIYVNYQFTKFMSENCTMTRTSTGPYRSCAALLAIPNPVILIFILSNLWNRISTCELVCGRTGWKKYKIENFILFIIWFGWVSLVLLFFLV